jgi:hypothetical protein
MIHRQIQWWMGLMLATAMVVGGCEAASQGFQRTTIDEVNLLAPPRAMEIDATAGVNATQARVLFAHRSKVVDMTGGLLEFAMYDGNAKSHTDDAKPLKTWRFTGREVSSHEGTMHGLRCYQFALPFEGVTPKSNAITLVARYSYNQQPPIYSAPVTIVVTDK